VRSDEVWHLYEGGPLELIVAPPDLSAIEHRALAAAEHGGEPVSIVPADWWQSARPLGEYALCGCTVAPGFDFEDFVFLKDDRTAVAALSRLDDVYRAWL
jgi:predicted cupin superfamily sugar epimerase